ncbi:hypothetical protein FLONG3_1756 [Fusarium longipes]|uniref:Uncharacterized protein n=1 Tax=Fusarium longipes TaxID=694270 RepID=A0A395T7D9_9HYPO|nr:hypothetical protein FLONG3_1756 [Fusarium longipes]
MASAPLLVRSRTTVFKPQCTHLTMTRVYDSDTTCSSCNEPGQFGWLYQCTQDRNKIIEEKLSCMDFLDYAFRKNSSTRKGSAEARQDKLSFLDELTPEQMVCYRPDQIATILRQREQLKNVIAQEELRERSLALLGNIPTSSGLGAPMDGNTGEWEYEQSKNCQYKVCPRCRPVCVDRAFLSLDAVAAGEIPLTAAAGFGFEALGGRPVIDKDVVKCINEHRPKANNRQMMEMLEEQIARMLGRHHKNNDLRNALRKTVLAPRPIRKLPIVKKVAATGQLQDEKESTPTNVTQHDDQGIVSSQAPDSMESPWPWLSAFENGNVTQASENQTQEQSTQQRLRATRIPRPTTPGSRSTRRRLADQFLFSTSYFPSAEGYPWRLLSSQTNAEARAPSVRRHSQTTGPQEIGTGKNLAEYSSMPLAVDNGVAMTEESIEVGVPDVVTQV